MHSWAPIINWVLQRVLCPFYYYRIQMYHRHIWRFSCLKIKKKSSPSLPAWQCGGNRPAGTHSCMQACPGCCLWAPPPSDHSPKGKITKQRLRTLSLQPKIHIGEEQILKYIKTRTSIHFTSLPASMVSLSRWPSSEPDATMALSMSPVAKWHTQYFSASLGACGGRN